MKLYHVCKLSAREFALNKTFRFYFTRLSSLLRDGGRGVESMKEENLYIKNILCYSTTDITQRKHNTLLNSRATLYFFFFFFLFFNFKYLILSDFHRVYKYTFILVYSFQR